LTTPVAIVAFYLIVMPLVVGRGQGPDSVAGIIVAGVFILLPLLAVVTGLVGLFQKDNPKWVPALSCGCGCLPLAVLVFGVVFVAVTGGV